MMAIVSRAGAAGVRHPGARAAKQAKGTVMLEAPSTSLIGRGILAVVVGIIAAAAAALIATAIWLSDS